MTPDERATVLEQIAAEIRTCTACRLHRSRTHAVPGEGHPETEVVFVGEGPGQNEDQQGRPFVGAAGGLLEELLARVGWRRDDVFITNVVKCRPPGNRDPEPDEIAACAGFLRRQLAALDPAVIVTLGRYSLGTFMPGAKISAAHGTTRPVDPATGAPAAVAFAMYHPAAAFRQAALKETLVADMANLPQVLLEARAARATRTESEATREEAVEVRPTSDQPMAGPSTALPEPAGTDRRSDLPVTDVPAGETDVLPGLPATLELRAEPVDQARPAPVDAGVSVSAGTPDGTDAPMTEDQTSQMTLF